MRENEFIVVGQGLAGTLLTYFLLKNDCRVTVVGDGGKNSSSRIAAGIIHPVTGRRMAKSWMADTFLPFAEETYSRCEALTASRFYERKEILELLREPKEMNDWLARSSDPELAGYVSLPSTVPHSDKLHAFPYAVSIHGGYLDTGLFLDALRLYIKKSCRVVDETFSFDSFRAEEDRVVYKDLDASRILFCEGYKGMTNPYWKDLPWQPSKGELLLIRCEDLQAEEIITRKIFILPVSAGIYKAGSTYAWDSLNEIPTEEARGKLCHELKKILKVPFEVIGHLAGVRPTVKERRPFLGFHPRQKRVGIFNGLGTKGVMTGPWLANHLSEHCRYHHPLLPETDVNRYAEILQNPS